MHLAGTLGLSTAQSSQAGRKPTNDDSFGLYVPSEPALLAFKGAAAVVADGVSAAESGREAAELCARGFLDDYFGTPEQWSVETSAQKVLSSLNRWLYAQGRRYPDSQRGYVCTLSALVLKSRQVHVFHVGDSRIYRVRDGFIEQLTHDHKLQVNATTAYLSRAMGLDVDLTVDHRTLGAEPGDVFVMTTDGVHDHVRGEDIVEQVRHARELQAASDALVALALANGSTDNLTCQIVRIDTLAEAETAELQQALRALPVPPALDVGSILDGMRVVSELHASPRSQVYLVEDVDSGLRMVMKTPSPNFEDDDAYLERFVMEAWVGTRVHSQHVVRSIKPTRNPTCLYHLQEYVAGKTLDRYMRENPQREVREVVDIVVQVARGLIAMHRKETIHRDLKPDNVMLADGGTAHILDFGSCFVAGIGEIAVPLVRDRMVGTVSYSAPEAFSGAGPDVRSDLFSLAVLSYELLTGKLPYGASVEDVQKTSDYNRLRYVPAYHINPLVPMWMDAALRKALRADPRLRYDELSEFVHDLEVPNPDFADVAHVPLVARNPLRFWRSLALALVVLQLATVYYFVRVRESAPCVQDVAPAADSPLLNRGRAGFAPAH